MHNGSFVLPLMLAGGREQGFCYTNVFLCKNIWEFLFLGFCGHSVIVNGGCLYTKCVNYAQHSFLFFFFFMRYNIILWTFWPSQHIISTYCDPGCSQSNSLFSVSSYHLLYHFPICSLVFLVVVLTSVSTYILLLPFSLPAFDVNGQTSLIFVLLCNLLYSMVVKLWVP